MIIITYLKLISCKNNKTKLTSAFNKRTQLTCSSNQPEVVCVYVCVCALCNYPFKFKKIYIKYHHHHHVTLSARIFLTLSRHPSQSSIPFGKSSGLHPISAQSCCMEVRAGCLAFARPCEGVHRSTSFYWSGLTSI